MIPELLIAAVLALLVLYGIPLALDRSALAPQVKRITMLVVLGLAVIGAILFIAFPAPTHAQGPMQVGFNIGGGHQSVAADLAGIGGSYVINFCCPTSLTDAPPDATDIRILRYQRHCPNDVFYGCTETMAQLAAWIAANPKGQVWETGNEPCISGQDSCRGLKAWQNNVYHTIKNADPTAFVLGPGVLSDNTGMYSGLLYDGIAFHIYQGSSLCGNAAGWLAEGEHTVDVWTTFAVSRGVGAYETEHSNFDRGCASDAVRHDNELALRNYMATKGVRVAIYFTEGDVMCCGTDFLYDINGLTPVGRAWGGQ